MYLFKLLYFYPFY